MSRFFWNVGRAYVLYAETPDPSVPALGRVNLEHDAPVPRQSLLGKAQCSMRNAQCSMLGHWSFIEAGHSLSIEHSALSIEPCSEKEHRITIAVEPISMSDSLFVDGEDLVAARKRRREDQQRRLRQMEVGDQAGDQLEAVTRADEEARLALASPDDSTLHVQ